ncbi:glycoside hydrolase family 13 protein [Marinitenerispora sediminis]|uniref:Alpha-amylase n=1 Tax=Marinitenerispora sediminis TaxID=1931232 RepID=A0A368T258_9ACTN|nr:glycoside hydrolase family 13 protein [Marinitenerispora sediminis]RCV50576.1 alpha-amylase [Marinitenerispora sediminis]RCV54627.1 alpha-amylase [Marinitenerispora sediminis]RCV54912.1 alpha-amylase [Marinitenerispora sediminis]
MQLTPQPGTAAPTARGRNWWREAVIYQVYVRSFADSNGDGEGDLEGIRQRLPKLAALGVDAIWLTPFYVSPLADGGYDVADYRDVDPRFGTLADFDALLADAHGLGLRLIIDIVPNHTSSAHRWFREAVAAEPGSPERERYLFRDGKGPAGDEPPNNWNSIFGGVAWTRLKRPDGTPEQWYLHLFDAEQPDLNWSNPEVWAEFDDVLRFWLDRGVDGFRIDVAHGMVKDPALPDILPGQQAGMLDGHTRLPYFDQDGVHEIYRHWRQIIDAYDDRAMVAEAWVEEASRVARYLRADELHQAFNFEYLTAPWKAGALRDVVEASLAANGAVGAPTTWVLSNHDVTRHVTRFGGGELGTRRARAATLLMLALPGSAYLYQGEELGLPEVTDLPEETLQDPTWERSGRTERGRDGCRVPLPWEGSEPPFGFGPPDSRPWLPVPAEWRTLSRAAQEADPGSTLSLYTAALHLRRELEALGDGTLTWLDAPEDVLWFGREPGFGCAVNLGDTPVRLPLEGKVLLSSGPVSAQDGTLTLPPDTAVWLGA